MHYSMLFADKVSPNSALETLQSGQFTFKTQLIKPNCLLTSATIAAPQCPWKLTLFI